MSDPILINQYNYDLSESRIAKFPLEERDHTKLLIVEGANIIDSKFTSLPNHLPSNSFLIFNNTRVINARLIFRKPSGSKIEIFCLSEESAGEGNANWQCYVGNSKRWKSEELTLTHENIALTATRISVNEDVQIIKFTWNQSSMSFSEILEVFGKVPLPPYLNREATSDDRERYQTIYAMHNGSVAAPTAGLHFTQKMLDELQQNHCSHDYVTLHVGAGTFKPVTVENALEHRMHEEQIIVKRDTLLRLIQNLQNNVTAVGTTSMRTLESLYWLGLQILNNEGFSSSALFSIDQWEPYQQECNVPAIEALTVIYDYMRRNSLSEISGYTRIMIIPGYKFRICKSLITNFHQPQSTLLLLVAAFIGDIWKGAYNHALANDYRFLSYGDSCLFMPEKDDSDGK